MRTRRQSWKTVFDSRSGHNEDLKNCTCSLLCWEFIDGCKENFCTLCCHDSTLM